MTADAGKTQAETISLAEAGLLAERGRPAMGAVAPLPRDDFDRDVWCVLGLPIDAADVGRAVEAIEASARDRRRLSFVTPNINWLVRGLKNETARREILNADLSLADGAPLAAIARLLGVPIRRRAAGADILEALRARRAADRPLRVFFFGGREGSAAGAAAALDRARGGLVAAGAMNPGYGDVETMSAPEIIEAINRTAPDFVIVALGAAKGQAWIDRNKERLIAPATAHLGAAVDFTAGAKARAPRWMQRSGLEWLWRIKEEPALLSRYLADGAALAGIMATRLAPQLFTARFPRAQKAGTASFSRSADAERVALSGDFAAGGLGEARRAFREAAAGEGDIILDLSAAGRVDRAFLGLVLMLEKHVRARGAALRVAGEGPALRALFKANAMNYPAAAAEAGGAPPIVEDGGARRAIGQG
ncbi:MAG: WecB/TagA/CpsF family glycosyltransferase [Amphiplicatus sp.]